MKCADCRGACCEEFSLDIFFDPPAGGAPMHWLKTRSSLPDKLTFESRCPKLNAEGQCDIHQKDEYPLICAVFLPGGPACLEVVKRRRTAEQYQSIRDQEDPENLC